MDEICFKIAVNIANWVRTLAIKRLFRSGDSTLNHIFCKTVFTESISPQDGCQLRLLFAAWQKMDNTYLNLRKDGNKQFAHLRETAPWLQRGSEMRRTCADGAEVSPQNGRS